MANELGYDGGLTCSMQVRDLDSAIDWYERRMGFTLLYRMDEMGWCELATAVKGVNVGLSVVEEPQVEGGATMTFGVKDIDSARKTLAGNDVRFDGETMVLEGMVKLATFYDPDGNKLMLFEDLSGQGGA